MPWRTADTMDERARFVHRLKGGETMAALCREFGISRKTGYKVRDRYLEEGLAGLIDRSRRPQRSPNRTPKDIVELMAEAAAALASERAGRDLGAVERRRAVGGRRDRRRDSRVAALVDRHQLGVHILCVICVK